MALTNDTGGLTGIVRRISGWKALTGVTMLVMLITIGFQGRRIRELEESVRALRRLAGWPAPGVTFPPLATTTLRGESRTVGARSPTSQIIAVFTTTCPICRASIPQWQRLSALADTSASLQMTWLSLSPRDSTEAYSKVHGLPEQFVSVDPSRELVLAARMKGVPLTLVVDSGGVIQRVHIGELNALQADSILLAARTPRAPRPVARAGPANP